MRELRPGQGSALRRAYRSLQGFLDTGIDVSIERLRLGFSVCFRHDMDLLDEVGLQRFLEADAGIGAPSTLFFMEEQVAGFGADIAALPADRYERALHSEAKPSLCVAIPQLSRLLERAYARRLRRQRHRVRRYLPHVRGHAAHAGNNYLPFQGWINWNIIENASLRAGFDYVSDWRLPARMAEGEEFLPPWPSYRRRRGGSAILVLTTSWDDKYFLHSWEDQHIRGVGVDTPYRDIDAETALAAVLRQAERCRAMQTPLILNLHPWHSVGGGQPQFMELKARLADWCAREGVPLRRCIDYVDASLA